MRLLNPKGYTMHHKLSPSSYAAWAICPHYQGGDSNADTLVGTEAHALLYRAFTGEIDLNDELATDNIDGEVLFPVRRAYEGINALINELFQGRESTRYYERRVGCPETLIPEAPYGTADVIAQCGEEVIVVDYKHRFSDRPHLHQLAAYAAFYQSEHPEVSNAILAVWYGDEGSYSVDHLSIEDCRALAIEACDARRNRAGKPCKSSAYCSICKWCGKCQESVDLCNKALAVIPAIDDNFVIKPEQMGAVLSILSDLEKRIEKARDYIREYAIIHGGICDSEGNLEYITKEEERSNIDILRFYDEVSSFLQPSQILESFKMSKKVATALLKSSGMSAKDAKALIARCSDPATTVVKLARVK